MQFAKESHFEQALEKNKATMGHRWVRRVGGWSPCLLEAKCERYFPDQLMHESKHLMTNILSKQEMYCTQNFTEPMKL